MGIVARDTHGSLGMVARIRDLLWETFLHPEIRCCERGNGGR